MLENIVIVIGIVFIAFGPIAAYMIMFYGTKDNN
jgi:hypothetical protein